MTDMRSDRRAFLGAAAGISLAGVAPGTISRPDQDPERGGPPRRAVRRERIPRSGELLPVIGLGTSRTFDEDPAGENPNLVAVMQGFLDWGGSLVDSSPMYKRSEAVVGELTSRVGRDDLFYATKVWTDEGKQAGIDQMERSARLMGTPRFDLLQVHNLVGLEVQLETLRAWRAERRVRYIGVTEMRDFAKVEELINSGELDFIQIPYSVTDRRVEARVLPACIEHGVAVLVMQPFQRGALFTAVKGTEVPGWAAEFGVSSWAQMFLKFILGHDAFTLPIPATSKPHHLDDNMAAGVGPALDAAARARLVTLLEG